MAPRYEPPQAAGSQNSFQTNTENETEVAEIISDDSIFVVPVTPIKKETNDQEFQAGLAVLEEMGESFIKKEPKTEPLDVKPKIEPMEELLDNMGDGTLLRFSLLAAL